MRQDTDRTSPEPPAPRWFLLENGDDVYERDLRPHLAGKIVNWQRLDADLRDNWRPSKRYVTARRQSGEPGPVGRSGLLPVLPRCRARKLRRINHRMSGWFFRETFGRDKDIMAIPLQTIVTFILFTIEAMIHFNIGKNSEQKSGRYKLFVPTAEEVFKIVATVGIFSALSTYFTGRIAKVSQAPSPRYRL